MPASRAAGQIVALCHGDRQVLVPQDGPIGFGRLVEEEGADGDGVGSHDGFDQFANGAVGGQFSYLRQGEQVAAAVGAAPTLDSLRACADGGSKVFDFVGWDDVRNDGEAVPIDRQTQVQRGFEHLSPFGRRAKDCSEV